MTTIRAICISLSFLALSSATFAQDPLPVLRASWQPAVRKAEKVNVPQTGPAKQITTDDTMIARTNREFQTDHPDNPSDLAPDGRRAAIERNEREADAVQPKDIVGFTYSATVRNDSAKAVKVVFWEYRFADSSDSSKEVRRQFLCSVNSKSGAEFDLRAFSTLGPTDVVNAKGLQTTQAAGRVRINRIEYSDDDILQRGDWSFAEVKAAVEKLVSTSWGKEPCKPL